MQLPLRFVETVAAFLLSGILLLLSPGIGAAADPNPLEQYVSAPDPSYRWKRVGEHNGFVELELTSQTWRGIEWRHQLLVYGEPDVAPSAPGVLFLTGGSAKPEDLALIEKVASRAHVVVALLTGVPNQPLFDGKKEDALVAYTFDQYTKTGDLSWPVIFPMVKSVVRAMDAVTEFTHGSVKRFVVSGSSKRGWTSYLTAAVDDRVAGVAPRVFEMVNIKAQTEWAQRVYGAQSEKLKDFTELGLISRIATEPRLDALRSWVDPYEYRARLTMPKLVVLGTNDRYWVVDSQRWYWPQLPAPKWLVQNPNLGHHLGENALNAIAAWLEFVAAGRDAPQIGWDAESTPKGIEFKVRSSAPPAAAALWKACAVTRDLREAPWISEKLEPGLGTEIVVPLETPKLGHCAYFVTERFQTPSGKPFEISTEAVVLPEFADAPVSPMRHPKAPRPS